ncbi:DUF4174 domain-containing protein [Methylobacterium dankookense]|uniref:DUF4174 domain-containing protein n=1 Tax=Methylobacterium dankookense TaxID=560405 RepID=A0A564FQA3_9HYPH|nr:DUF4174 domain-containing protein [Methylobacterium dankookense]GJD58896.1 hypothetical protein IFDJLNFL_4822 [Methylobacterium dankookense]VUF10353.1 hypothetical protein MTDSW087_00017 [Methylobacterium dankookense]
MRIGLGTLGMGVALALAGGPAGNAAPDPLAAHRWHARVLVLAAPDGDDARLKAQREAVAAAQLDFSERDLVVVDAVGPGAEAAALRRRLGLPEAEFRAVLVGKDGEAKITASEPIPPERLFATIDAMPMRRDEMRSRR